MESYHMTHKAPHFTSESAAPLYDLEKIAPGFYFDVDYYDDTQAIKAIKTARGKPTKKIKIFRAVPVGVDVINPGDWVTTSKAYAKGHAEKCEEEQGQPFKILEITATAAEIFTDLDDIREMSFWPLSCQK